MSRIFNAYHARGQRGDPPYKVANAAVNVIGMQAITGSSETWFLEPHQSFAGIEALDRTAPALTETNANRLIGMYRFGLSYRPDEALKLMASARYFQVTIFRIRPGADVDFAELIRIRRGAFDAINLDRPELGYQILSGDGSGMYVFLSPLPSLRTLDNGLARIPPKSDAIVSPRGKEGRQIAWEADITREHLLFRVQPAISHVSDAFASGDSDFWRGR